MLLLCAPQIRDAIALSHSEDKEPPKKKRKKEESGMKAFFDQIVMINEKDREERSSLSASCAAF